MLRSIDLHDPMSRTTESAPDARNARTRLYYLDHLRVALTMLVIVHHLALTYGALGPWYYQEPSNDLPTTVVLTVLMLMNQAFFMGCFFLLAGFFTPGSYDRKGWRAFLADRLLRLGVPLLVYELVLGPLATLPVYRASLAEAAAAGSAPPSYWDFYVSHLDPGPLWFVEVLLIFSGLYALVRRVLPQGEQRGHVQPGWPGPRAIAGFAVILAAVTFLWRLVVPMGLYVPILGLPTLSHLPQYAGLFAIGVLASRRDWLADMPDAAGGRGLGIALASLVLLPIALIGLPAFTGGPNWQAALYAIWEAAFCVGMIVGLLPTFRRRFGHQGLLGRFLSQQAYAVYVIHAPLLVGVAYALRAVEVYPLLKFVLATAVAIPLCFGAAFLVRILPYARRIL